MTFPLGSLRADGAASARSGAITPVAAPLAPADCCSPPARSLWILFAAGAGDAQRGRSGVHDLGHRRAGAQPGRPARRLGVRHGLLPVRLLGLVAGAGGFARLAGRAGATGCVAPRNRLRRAAPRAAFWIGLALLLSASSALEWTRLYRWEDAVARPRRRRARRDARATVDALARLRRLRRAVDRGAGRRRGAGAALLLGARGRRDRRAFRRLRERRAERRERAEDRRLGERAQREREQVVEIEHQVRRGARCRSSSSPPWSTCRSPSASPRSGRSRCSSSSPTPSCRRSTCSTPRRAGSESVPPESLEMTARLIEKKLKDFGVEVRVVAASPGPVITRYEIEPATGVKGAQVVNLAKDLARSLSLVSIRVVETIPGKTTMALELPNAKPADDPPGRDPRLAGLQRRRVAADHRPGQGHRRQPGRRRPREDAALPGRRHHRRGQERGHQRDDPEPALQGRGARRAPDPDRSEDARDERLRRHPAPARAGGHRHEAGRQRAQLVRRRDGAPLQADEQARRAQPGRLQQEDRGGAERGETLRQPVQPDARRARAAGAAAARRGRDRRTRRPDDGGRQEDRGVDRAPGAEGAGLRHPPDPRHAAAERRRDHRPDQGQHPDAPLVPGQQQDRQPHHPRPDGRRGAARSGRHALPARRAAACRCACTAPSSATTRCTASSST